MTIEELRQEKAKAFPEYRCIKWERYKFSELKNIMYVRRSGRGDNDTYNDCIIMADTETSKEKAGTIGANHVCAFTISIRAFNKNIVTLYGTRPSELVKCFNKIRNGATLWTLHITLIFLARLLEWTPFCSTSR